MNRHDYFYGAQEASYPFFRTPLQIFNSDDLPETSLEARFLYCYLLNRVGLSAKNGWTDEQGRVYIYCTIAEIMKTVHCANHKAIKLLDELEHGAGLIERKRQGLCKPNRIYVKNFLPPKEQEGEQKEEE